MIPPWEPDDQYRAPHVGPELGGAFGGDDCGHAGGSTRSQKVTGPSLTRLTCMCAPNSPVGDRRVRGARLRDGMVEQAAPERRVGGRAEARAITAPRIGRKRELRDEQQPAAGIAEAQVHLPRAVREQAEGQDPVDEACGARLRVAALGAGEREDAGTDLADGAAVDRDARFGDPLEQRDHRPAGSRAFQARAGVRFEPGLSPSATSAARILSAVRRDSSSSGFE